MTKVIDAGFRLTNRVNNPLADTATFDIEGPGVTQDGGYLLVFNALGEVRVERLLDLESVCRVFSVPKHIIGYLK